MGACTATGKNASGKRLDAMKASPNWKDGKFGNELPKVQAPLFEMLGKFFTGGSDHRDLQSTHLAHSSPGSSRLQSPLLPPLFAHSSIGPILMPFSTALHMS